jgi:hypothetical protein
MVLMNHRFASTAGLCSALLLAVALNGCATHSQLRKELVRDVRTGQYEHALKDIDKLHEDASKKDLVMDLMDKGMVLHMMGKFKESNAVLDKAKLKLDELFGVSVSEELASIAWNDTAASFQGEEFERVMVNAIMAMNYLGMGMLQDAGVEARQINHKLQLYTDRLAKNKVKTSYDQDPFSQFLTGLVYEAMQEKNDAFRSYEDALNGYEKIRRVMNIPVPETLQAAVLRSAVSLGHAEAIEKYQKPCGHIPESDPSFWTGKAKVVVIAAFGQVAHKESAKWTVVDPMGDVISVAYPVFRRGCSAVSTLEVTSDGRRSAHLADDVSSLAINVLNDKNDQVKGRATAKAMVRYAAAKATKVVAATTDNTYLQLGMLAANIAVNAVSLADQADTRSWMTLPDQFWISVFPVEPGQKSVTLTYMGYGHVVDNRSFSINAEAGKTYFIVDKAREPAGAYCR